MAKNEKNEKKYDEKAARDSSPTKVCPECNGHSKSPRCGTCDGVGYVWK